MQTTHGGPDNETTIVLPLDRTGNYQPIERLAIGRASEVFLAVTCDGGPASHVVIKRLRRARDHQAQALARFVAEAQIGASLLHRNLTHVFEHGDSAQGYVQIMSYYRGASLSQILATASGLHGAEATQIALDLAAALHYLATVPSARGRGIVHGDVSPSNVIVTLDGNVKLIDFSHATPAGQDSATAPPSPAVYVAPERLVGGRFDARSDQFSLGVLLYELLANRPMRRDASLGRLSVADLAESAQLRPEAAAVLKRMIAPRPVDRFRSCDDVRIALGDAGMGTATGVRERLGKLARQARQEPSDDDRTEPRRFVHA